MRTEQQHADMAPVSVKLGGTTYEIPLLRRGQAAVWRNKIAAEIVSVFDAAVLPDNPRPETIASVFTNALAEFPERLLSALFAYYPELPASVSKEASDGQVRVAFSAVWEATFPFEPLLTALRAKFASGPVQ